MSDTIEYLDFSSTLKESKPYPSIVILDDVIESSVCDRIISQASNFESAGVYRGSFDPQIAKNGRNNQTAWGKDCVKLGKDELNAMTKAQLELVGRDNGIELDKRKTKKALVEELYEVL